MPRALAPGSPLAETAVTPAFDAKSPPKTGWVYISPAAPVATSRLGLSPCRFRRALPEAFAARQLGAARPLPVGVPYPRGVPLASPPAEKEGVGGLRAADPTPRPAGALVTDLSTLSGNAFSFRALGFRGVPLPCEKEASLLSFWRLRALAPGSPFAAWW